MLQDKRWSRIHVYELFDKYDGASSHCNRPAKSPDFNSMGLFETAGKTPKFSWIGRQSVEEWTKADRRRLKTLVESLPGRIGTVIQVGGGLTEYY